MTAPGCPSGNDAPATSGDDAPLTSGDDAPTAPRWRSASLLGSAMVLLAVLPFELRHPAIEIAQVEFRIVHLVAAAVTLLAFVLAPAAGLRKVPRAVWLLLAAYMGGLLASWALASGFPLNARRTAVRLLIPPAVAIGVTSVLMGRPRAHLRAVAWALCGGAALAAVVGLGAWSAGGDLGPSSWFRGSPTSLGPHPRLTRPFNHANVAAMFLAPVALLTIGLVVGSWQRLSRRARTAPVACAVLSTAAALASYSRMVPVVLVLGVLWFVVGGLASRRRVATTLALVVGAVVLFVALAPGWDARLTSPGRQAWFAADIDVPAELRSDDAEVEFTAIVRNDSTLRWEASGPDRVELSLRWRTIGDDLQFAEDRFALPADLDPGESATIDVRSQRPSELARGTYRVVVDLIEDREAYYQEVLGGSTVISFEGGVAARGLPGAVIERPTPELARTDLWRAAWSLGLREPLFGVGPGNFRLLYGPELGLDDFPRGSHAHSLFLEPFASTGAPVAASLIAIFAMVTADARVRQRRGGLDGLEISLFAAVMAMGVQGLVDWPLIFTSTGFLFWMLLALWVASRRGGEAGAR